MSECYIKDLIDKVSGIEVKNETQQFAKYELISAVETFREKMDKVIELRKILNNAVLDELPFDIAEEIQDLFDEILEYEIYD